MGSKDRNTVLLVIFVSLLLIMIFKKGNALSVRKFPTDFIFGVSTSAHQIEGAWNHDGKGMSIWDQIEHTGTGFIADNSTAEIACDSYRLYKRDVEMLRELNAKMYRFSISWPRILPYGFANYTNPAGIAYYNNLINELRSHNIEPFITIYHWDLPVILQDLGGFANPFMAMWFSDYARALFENFGDRVKYWVTFNEPFMICFSSYDRMELLPLIDGAGIADYMCAYNLLKAHAEVYHIYQDEFRRSQNGKVGIANLFVNTYPATNTTDDLLAKELAQDFFSGIFVDPIYSAKGDYPSLVKKNVAFQSKKQGFPRSRLIPFTKAEIENIKGTYDFMGVNHYSSWFVYKNSSLKGRFRVPSVEHDAGVGIFFDESWNKSTISINRDDPRSLYRLLKHINKKYGTAVEIFVTECGWSTTASLDDDGRVSYFRNQLNGLLTAIQEGANVGGYLAWSLMDNFEWAGGYTQRLGLYDVDFKSKNRSRTPKKSAFYFKQLAGSLMLDPYFDPIRTEMWIDAWS